VAVAPGAEAGAAAAGAEAWVVGTGAGVGTPATGTAGLGEIAMRAGEAAREGAGGGEWERTFCSGTRVSESPLPDPALFSWPSPGERRSTLPLQRSNCS
jgi:hypothetical protein